MTLPFSGPALPATLRGRHGWGVKEIDEQAGPVMRLLAGQLAGLPAVVFSGRGEVLLQTPPARALIGGHRWRGGSSCCRHLVEVGPGRHHRLRRYRHAELGELELYRQLLVDAQERQVLMVLTAPSGSPAEEKLRLL
jgi:hypothetical protein